MTDAWQMVNSPIKPKTNTYSFYVTTASPVRPVRYEMFGADTLLGSHYDKYYIHYTFLDYKTAQPASTFDPPKGKFFGEMIFPSREIKHSLKGI